MKQLECGREAAAVLQENSQNVAGNFLGCGIGSQLGCDKEATGMWHGSNLDMAGNQVGTDR
jgi:hypothetical protein